MKKLLFFLALFIGLTGNAQQSDKQRVLTFLGTIFQFSADKTVNNLLSTTNSSIAIGIQPNVLYGVRKNNKLFSYGANVLFSGVFPTSGSGLGTDVTWGIAPAVGYQQFFPVSSNFFISPFSIAKVGYRHRSYGFGTSVQYEDAIFGGLEFCPFSVSFQQNKSTMILFSLGAASLDYSTTKGTAKNTLPDDYVRSSILEIAIRPSITFGIQKMF